MVNKEGKIGMKKEHFEKIVDVIDSLLSSIIIPVFTIFIVGGFVIATVKDAANQNFEILLTFAQISLTLFGFTLIGGIFEKNKKSPVPKILGRLFHLSIIFLSSAISFFFIYSFLILNVTSGSLLFEKITEVALLVAMVVGYIGFGYGIVFLLRVLVLYTKELYH